MFFIPQFLLFPLLFVIGLGFSPNVDTLANDYISKHRDLAVSEMHRSGIPASITLAQALHESNYGTSDLAVKANNHFGIKCKKYWNGKTYLHKDDDLDRSGNLIHSCFRSYNSTSDSYIDHTEFLSNSSNYIKLFEYSKTDYLNWAHGLKKSGYATDPDYAIKLIKKIEKYDLSKYDFWD